MVKLQLRKSGREPSSLLRGSGFKGLLCHVFVIIIIIIIIIIYQTSIYLMVQSRLSTPRSTFNPLRKMWKYRE